MKWKKFIVKSVGRKKGVGKMKINLYHEIVEELEENNKTIKDIFWVGTNEATIDRAQFLEETKDIEYDNGFGGAEIASDLILVGVDWWLSRGEYDGSEWWTFNTLPRRPRIQRTKFDLRGSSLFEGLWWKGKILNNIEKKEEAIKAEKWTPIKKI
jgi:hypothetical protein